MTEADLRQLKATVEQELDKENAEAELEAFKQLADAGGAGSAAVSSAGVGEPSGGRVPVKSETNNAGDVMAGKIESMNANQEQLIARMRMINLEVQKHNAKADDDQTKKGKTTLVFHRGL